MTETKKRNGFASGIGFVLAAAGSAVGLGKWFYVNLPTSLKDLGLAWVANPCTIRHLDRLAIGDFNFAINIFIVFCHNLILLYYSLFEGGVGRSYSTKDA